MEKIRLFWPGVGLGLMGLLILFSLFLPFGRGNIREIQDGPWHGLLRDSCHSSRPSAQECGCVAFVHDLADSALTWKEVMLWPEDQWQQVGLDRPLRLLAVDLPGFGESLPPSQSTDYQARKQAGYLGRFLSHYCPSWVLVGNGFGGWVATWLALDQPQHVHRLLLLAAAGLQKGTDWSFLASPSLDQLKEFYQKSYFKPQPLSDGKWKSILRQVQASPVREIVDAQQKGDYLDSVFPTLQTPTLLVWGQADRLNPIAVAQQIKIWVPSAGLREVPGCGHFLQKECPGVVVHSIVDLIHAGKY